MKSNHPSSDPISVHQKHYYLEIPTENEFAFQSLKNSPLSPANLPSPKNKSPVVRRSQISKLQKNKAGTHNTSGNSNLFKSSFQIDEDGFSSPLKRGNSFLPPSPSILSSIESHGTPKQDHIDRNNVEGRTNSHSNTPIKSTNHLESFPFLSGLERSRAVSEKGPQSTKETHDCFSRFTRTLKLSDVSDRPLTGVGTMKRNVFANTEISSPTTKFQDTSKSPTYDSQVLSTAFRPATMWNSTAFAAQLTDSREGTLDVGTDQDIEMWCERINKQQLASMSLTGRWDKRRKGTSPKRSRTAPVLVNRATFPSFKIDEAAITSVRLKENRPLGSIFDGDWVKTAALQQLARSKKKLDPADTKYYTRKEYYSELQQMRLKGVDSFFVKDKSDEAHFMNILYAKKVGFVLAKRQGLKKRVITKWKTFVYLMKTFKRIYLYYKHLRKNVLDSWYGYAKRHKRIRLMMLEHMMGPVRLTYKAWKSYAHVHAETRRRAKKKQRQFLFDVLHAIQVHAKERIGVKKRLLSKTMFTLTRNTFELWKIYATTQKRRREKAMNSFLSTEAAVFHSWRRHTRNQKLNRRHIEERRRKTKKKIFDSWKFWAKLIQKQRRELILKMNTSV